MFENLTRFLDSFLELGIPYYDCIVKIHGETVYRHQNGYLDQAKTVGPTGTELTNFYSCSKQVTCTAALQLWEKGLFRLEDELGKYLPEFAEMTVRTENGIVPCPTPIRIQDLFDMSAGFDYSLAPTFAKAIKEETQGLAPTREAIRLLAREPLAFVPGSFWKYSVCHDVLAALVEELSGQRFGLYVKEHIFDVCGMPRSTFYTPDVNPDELAPQYLHDKVTGAITPIGPDIYSLYNLGPLYESGGAGLRSTVDEYIRFLEHLRSGESLLKRSTISLMTANRYESRAYTWNGGKYGYGLGCRVPLPSGKCRDFGWGGKAGQYFGIDLEHDLTFLYSQHVVSPPNSSTKHRIAEIIAEEVE